MGCSLDKIYEMSSEEHDELWRKIKEERRERKKHISNGKIESIRNTLILLNSKAEMSDVYTKEDKKRFNEANKILENL